MPVVAFRRRLILERVAPGEARRHHERIDKVIESTELRAFYEVVFDIAAETTALG